MGEVFYRKWRPQRLDQVVGQEPVSQTLRNAVALGRVAHAYFFCGPRGTGKTSTARILAKAVNCLSPQEGEPDNACRICVSITEGRALDLIEIDAASNRGIDDIRSLREKVHFTPNEARYKVYIVDEAHMLTEQAFNALLKTLEEPPDHALFVLATTEVHKVPLTIVSRCQRFDFRRIPPEAAVARLGELCKDEGIEASPEALMLIARTSTGSLRDAENLLEQALVSYGSTLAEQQVRDLLGLAGDERALELAGHIVNRSVSGGLTVINAVAGEGIDLRQYHRGVLDYLRGVLLLKSGSEAPLGYSAETKAEMKALAERAPLGHIVRAMKAFAKVDMRRDTPSTLPLELALAEASLEDVADAAADPPKPAAGPAADPPRSAVGTPVDPPKPAAGPAADPPRSAVGTPVDPPKPAAGPAANPPRSAVGTPVDPPRQAANTAVGAGSSLVAGASPSKPPLETSATPKAPSGHVREQPRPAESSSAAPARLSEAELPSEPSPRLEAQWGKILRTLDRRKGKRFDLGALLRSTAQREIADGTITLRYAHPSHQQRMQEELDDPQAGKLLRDTLAEAMGDPYQLRASVVDGAAGGPRRSVSQTSHLVRAARAMGAQIVGEKEEEDDEQEDAQAGPAASKEHDEDAGGA